MNPRSETHSGPLQKRFTTLIRPQLGVEALILLVCLWLAALCNNYFWQSLAASHGGDARSLVAAIRFHLPVALTLVAIHFALLATVANRWIVKPLLSLIVVASAFAAHFMQHYHVYLDPAMLRNVLRTDAREAGELLNWQMLPLVALYAVPPLLLIWRVQLRKRRPWPAIRLRIATIAIALTVAAGSIFAIFQDLSALMREHKELRYLAVPGNFIYSLARVAAADTAAATSMHAPIGEDATLGATARGKPKPTLLVLVVGETARAANWGLSGYSRQTTPELAAIPEVINFPDVTACGTSTEVSVPCLFSPLGRRAYDENRIRHSESLLHVLQRAGYRVVWIDNQSGCKGVCDGIESRQPDPAAHPGLCKGKACLDEALVDATAAVIDETPGNLVVVLHLMGNHGPAYFRRYPPAFRRFLPACEDADLGRCSREEIVNAYDNALLYTDHVLARTIALLRSHGNRRDAALLFVSDHGESLGENGLFLHGVPYAIAPGEQKNVPMILWLPEEASAGLAADSACVRRRAREPAAHDNWFHTVLGLLDVRTNVYLPALDLLRSCGARPSAEH